MTLYILTGKRKEVFQKESPDTKSTGTIGKTSRCQPIISYGYFNRLC
nr:MAG TPA: hypothetical protein [Caudoviricetes sp.]